jgi:hypothetical protein
MDEGHDWESATNAHTRSPTDISMSTAHTIAYEDLWEAQDLKVEVAE